jgi:TRAP-type mannitol/chloroaromatic compound transport system permease large subunit
LLAVGYGADYSRFYNRMIIGSYGALAALFLGYLLVAGFSDIQIDHRVVAVALFTTLFVGIVLVPGTSFSFGQLKDSVFLTARTTAMVCWLFIGSFTFSAVFAYLGGHEPIEKFVLAMNLDTLGFMILAQFIIFLLGWPLEWTEIIVIFMPIFLPLLKTFNVDPLFFGILVALNIQTSFLSPPVAMAPFYLKGVAPKWVSINDIFRGVLPFLLIVIISMIMLYTFPQIGLWLPTVLYP